MNVLFDAVPSASFASFSGYTNIEAEASTASPQETILISYVHPESLGNTSYSLSVGGFGFSWSPLESSDYIIIEYVDFDPI